MQRMPLVGLLDKLYHVSVGVCIEIDVDCPTSGAYVSGDLRVLGDVDEKDFKGIKNASHVHVSFADVGRMIADNALQM